MSVYGRRCNIVIIAFINLFANIHRYIEIHFKITSMHQAILKIIEFLDLIMKYYNGSDTSWAGNCDGQCRLNVQETGCTKRVVCCKSEICSASKLRRSRLGPSNSNEVHSTLVTLIIIKFPMISDSLNLNPKPYIPELYHISLQIEFAIDM